MVVPPGDGPRYARNIERLTKYTKNKLYIKLVFLYTSTKFTLHGDLAPGICAPLTTTLVAIIF